MLWYGQSQIALGILVALGFLETVSARSSVRHLGSLTDEAKPALFVESVHKVDSILPVQRSSRSHAHLRRSPVDPSFSDSSLTGSSDALASTSGITSLGSTESGLFSSFGAEDANAALDYDPGSASEPESNPDSGYDSASDSGRSEEDVHFDLSTVKPPVGINFSPARFGYAAAQQQADQALARAWKKSYDACLGKGRKNWNNLQSLLRSTSPPPSRDAARKNFNEYYLAIGPEWTKAPRKLKGALALAGVTDERLLQSWEVDSRKERNSDASATIIPPYETIYVPSKGVLIVDMALKEQDMQQKLFHSDILFLTLEQRVIPANMLRSNMLSPTRFQVRKLSVVIHNYVVNFITKRTILHAYAKYLGLTEHQVKSDGIWRQWSPDGPYPEAFLALCGTDNVKGTLYMLKDYRSELGRKTIRDIWTRGDSEPDIWINLMDWKPGQPGQVIMR